MKEIESFLETAAILEYMNGKNFKDLAKQFDSHPTTIYNIITNRTWKHIDKTRVIYPRKKKIINNG